MLSPNYFNILSYLLRRYMNDPSFLFPEGYKEKKKKRRGRQGKETESPKQNLNVKASIRLSSL